MTEDSEVCDRLVVFLLRHNLTSFLILRMDSLEVHVPGFRAVSAPSHGHHSSASNSLQTWASSVSNETIPALQAFSVSY
jgi:hypothetical protein